MLKRSLLIVAALAWVAPLSAGAPSTTHVHAKGKCAKPQAKATWSKPVAAKPGVPKAQTVAPRVSMPEAGSIFSLGRASLLTP
jgi:Cu/Zn superoxide dismutase